MKEIIIGARASLLSICQANTVIQLLKKKFPQYNFLLKTITTLGDKTKTWQHQDKGIFVREIEESLIKKEIDMAVHSVKDLPVQLPDSLKLAAVLKREDPRDILITRQDNDISSFGNWNGEIKNNAVIGTSSLRRAAQLLHYKKDLQIKDLRGNLDTRIEKLKQRLFDGIVVASAGVLRLSENINYHALFFQFIPTEIMLPSAGQGAVGIEIRKQDKTMEEIACSINHPETWLSINCERAFLKEIGAGCRLPVGVLAQIRKRRMHLEGAIISLDGKKIIRQSLESSPRDWETLGKNLAKTILKKGGKEILKQQNIECRARL